MQKQTYIFLFLILILIAGLNSCTIEKRSYQPGYYVDWHNVNRKSNANPENSSIEKQEIAFHEKEVKENNVDKIKDFNQPEVTQEYETIYASNDDNVNTVFIINSTKQESNFTKYSKEVSFDNHAFVKKKQSIKSPNKTKEDTKVHWTAIVGFTSGILAWLLLVGIAISSNFAIIFVASSLLFSMTGIIFSIIALRKASNNQQKYSGKQLASHGLFISAIYLSLFIFLILAVFIL